MTTGIGRGPRPIPDSYDHSDPWLTSIVPRFPPGRLLSAGFSVSFLLSLNPDIRNPIMQFAHILRGRTTAGIGLLFLAFSMTGCAKTGTVKGTVKFGGKPLMAGKIIFHGPGGVSEPAEITDGEYTIKAPLGANKITVDTSYLEALRHEGTQGAGGKPGADQPGGEHLSDADKQKLKDKEHGGGAKEKQEESEKKMKELAAKYTELPTIYAEEAKSGLTFTVEKGTHTFDIDLKIPDGWQPGQRRIPQGGGQPGGGAPPPGR